MEEKRRMRNPRNYERLSEFGKKLRALRVVKKIDAERLAELVDTKAGRIYRAEMLGRHMIDDDVVERISALFDTTVSYFDDAKPQPPMTQDALPLVQTRQAGVAFVVMTPYGRIIGTHATIEKAQANCRKADGETIQKIQIEE